MGTGFAKRKKQAKMMQDQFQAMQQTMKEIEVVGHDDQLEEAILTNVFEVLDDGVFVLVVERIRNVVD